MKIHLDKYDVLRLIFDKYKIDYDLLRDEHAVIIGITPKEPVYVSWDGSTVEFLHKPLSGQ